MGGLGGTPPIRRRKKKSTVIPVPHAFFRIYFLFISYFKQYFEKKKKAILCLSEPTLKKRPYCIMKQQNSQNLDI